MATAKPDYRVICELTADDTRYDELERVLIAGSNLPGPRANLALAAAFADCIAAEGATEPQWTLLTEWLAIAARISSPGCARSPTTADGGFARP